MRRNYLSQPESPQSRRARLTFFNPFPEIPPKPDLDDTDSEPDTAKMESAPLSPRSATAPHESMAALSVKDPSKPAETAVGEPKLSNAELKLRKKAEKQAKRQAKKPDTPTAQASSSQASSSQGPNLEKAQAKQAAPKAGTSQATTGAAPAKSQPGSRQHRRRESASSGSANTSPTVVDDKRVAIFKHLYPEQRRTTIEGAAKEVHPAVLALGLQMSSYEICGSTARCLGMLQVFKSVIQAYTTPTDSALARHFISHCLSPQIDYLKSCRPLSIGMGNAIRHLKDAIVKVDPQMEELEAKQHLIEVIDSFINERITAADTLIAKAAAAKIESGDVILTYAKSSIVYRALLEAHAAGKSFRVIVVDSKPLHEGKTHAKDLGAAGIKVELMPMTAAWHAVRSSKKVMLGAHAMMGNGSLYSRVGTGNITVHAYNKGIPVIVCCESFKFTDKVYLDAITNNEIAPVEELFEAGPKGDALIELFKNTPNLQMLNVMYDLTPAIQVAMVITEHGNLPPSSVPAVLRTLENAKNNA